MRCKKCQLFGHTKKRCTKDEICPKCSNPLHELECTSPTKCINCTRFCENWPEKPQPHAAFSKSCPKFLEEKGITKISVDYRIPYVEARRKFNSIYPKTESSSTFAATVKKPSKPNTNTEENNKTPTEPKPTTKTNNEKINKTTEQPNKHQQMISHPPLMISPIPKNTTTAMTIWIASAFQTQ